MSALQSEEAGKLLDAVGWQILRELQADARLSYAELGRRVGLSSPAVMERVKKLEEAGIIRGYSVDLDLSRLGLPIMAYVRVANAGLHDKHILDLVQEMPEVLECHHVTGNDAFIIKVAAASIAHLERILTRFFSYNQTTTSIVLSSPIISRSIEPLNDGMFDSE